MEEFRTPWDDLDLDLVSAPREIPRLKLDPPTHYLGILPNKPGRSWQELWRGAKNAFDIHTIINECKKYEQKSFGRLNASKPDPIPESSLEGAQDPHNESIKEESLSPPRTGSGSHRKRPRSKEIDDGLHYVPKAKRLKSIVENTEIETLPTGPLDIADIPLPSIEVPIPDDSMPTTTSSPDPRLTVSLTAEQFTILTVIWALLRLTQKAGVIENKLYAIQARFKVNYWLEISATSPEKQREQLEEELEEVQASASILVKELDNRTKIAWARLGIGSQPLTEYMAEDPQSMFSENYVSDLHWQMYEYGLFGWWLAQMNGEL